MGKKNNYLLTIRDMDRFVVGSKAFFTGIEGFQPHDNDILLFEENPKDYKDQSQVRLKGNCYFRWRRMGKDELIEYHKPCRVGLFLGKFLVPEFAKEIGMTTEDLKHLDFLVDCLDERHGYEKIIYDSYIENGDFYLTEEQRNRAYEEYKRERE